MKRELVRIIKECGHRGKLGHIYEVIEKSPRDGFRLVMPGKTQFTFYYPVDCCETVEPGACTVPTKQSVPFDSAKWSQSLRALEEATTGLDLEDIKKKSTWQVPENADFGWHLDKVAKSVTDLLKEKNAAYGNSALNPANIFSKLDAVESLLVRMDDKIMRIKNRGINDETEDTVTDLIGYLFLLKMAMERKK
jgi:hypothetical protein